MNADPLECLIAATDQSIVTITPGDRITIEVTVTVPENYYAEDVAMEIFTDDVNGTFAVLCEPVVTAGANVELEFNTTTMEYNTAGFMMSVR